MRVLLIGKGAREHALAWKLTKSPKVSSLLVWPGNAAMAPLGLRLDVSPDASMAEIAGAAKRAGVDLVVVGPEGPLEAGLADRLSELSLPVFGPSAEAAQLEASKAYAKSVMRDARIPTAAFTLAHDEASCREAAMSMLGRTGATVLKASGLAAGKGVFVCTNDAEVEDGLVHLFHTDMKKAAATVVVEERLIGRECSYFSFVGNGRVESVGFAVDFKRLEDGDKGPNTGGMGCYAPVPWLPPDAAATVGRMIVTPLLREMEKRGAPYTGCLYTGLMWGEHGPNVVEFNVRLGDPEAQILAVQDPRDWLGLMAACAGVAGASPVTAAALPTKGATVGVVMASRGYPFGVGEKPGVELPKSIFEEPTQSARARVFAASIEGESLTVRTGKGRVLTVVGHGTSIDAARERVYARVDEIARQWKDARFRSDIAKSVPMSGEQT